MNFALCALTIACLSAAQPAENADEVDKETRAQWRQMYDGVASSYKLTTESEKENFKLIARPVYTWARSGANGGSYGCVYVWTDRGNAASVACFWRYPRAEGDASLVHELHSLAPVVLQSRGTGSESWKPKAGLKRQPIPNAPVPAATAAGRMLQMRALCRDFAARSVSETGERTELRLLPQPLYRYQSSNPDVLDGGLFAYVCSVGTDPEVFLQLEAIKTDEGPRWHFAVARFSHLDLFVNYKDKEVWRAIRDTDNTMSHNADHTYWVFGQPFDSVKLSAENTK